MPTYEYECKECKYRFEEFQKITDKPLTRCPRCKGEVRRLISGGAGLIFKGNGFYVTDYRCSHLPERRNGKGTHLKKPDSEPKAPANVPKESED